MDEPTNSQTPSKTTPGPDWERELLERLAFASIQEQRRTRRWGIFFKVFFVFYLLVFLFVLLADNLGTKAIAGRHTALVDIEGVILPDSFASADNVIFGLRSAFQSKSTAAVILRANSPGGSPVQAAYINDEIKRLRVKYPKIPVYAVISEVCASGCYYAVVAADKIYADKTSLVGSIGVLMDGFGFVNSLNKLGVERRLLTAGEYKGFLDPFSPMKPTERRHAQGLLDRIHKQFIARVREGRGEALKPGKDVFSGLFWTGEQAVQLGLIDDFGSAGYVAREVIGAEEVVDYTFRENVIDRFARRLGTTMAHTIGTGLLYGVPNLK